MARTKAVLGMGARLADYLSASLLARVFPAEVINDVLDAHGRNSQRLRSFPAVVGVYYCMALSLYPEAAYEEVFAAVAQERARAQRRREPDEARVQDPGLPDGRREGRVGLRRRSTTGHRRGHELPHRSSHRQARHRGHVCRGLQERRGEAVRAALAREHPGSCSGTRTCRSRKHCHDRHAGQRLAGGYPIYRLEWQGMGSLQRRLRGCLTGVRAEPFGADSDEFTALELFLMQRAAGMPVETTVTSSPRSSCS